MRVGIEKLRAWPSTLALDLGALAEARGVDPTYPRESLMTRERSVMPPWEDPVTMAVNAAAPLIDDVDRGRIELLIVATETGVDLEKPISSWVHRFLELPSSCRNFELKHACYSGTAALMMAASHLSSPFASPDGKALVVATDASLLGIGEPYEYVLGAGAAAALVSRTPRFLALHPRHRGVYASEVTDVIRPTGRVETGNSETSLFSYLEAVDGTFDALEAVTGPTDYRSAYDRHLYHAPFGGITFRAHKRVLGRSADVDKASAWEDYERRVRPSLHHARRIGGTYGGSLFMGMLGLTSADDALPDEASLCVFSYGSGSCAEAYEARLGPQAKAIGAQAGLARLLDARERIDVETYERLERERADAWGQPDYTPREIFSPSPGLLALRAVRGFVREYGWT